MKDNIPLLAAGIKYMLQSPGSRVKVQNDSTQHHRFNIQHILKH